MDPMSKKLICIRLLVFAAFFVVSIVGPAHTIGMNMNDKGHMSGCMFTGTAVCTMTPLEHFAAWQSTFSAIPANAASLFLLLLLLALVLLVNIVGRLPFREQLDWLAVRQRLYARHSRAFAYASPLQEAYSQGILNPKVY